MYLYNICLSNDAYYEDEEDYFIYHKQYFTKREFLEHIRLCVPELVKFVKYELPFAQIQKREQEILQIINEFSNHSEEEIDKYWNSVDKSTRSTYPELKWHSDLLPLERHQRFLANYRKNLSELKDIVPKINTEFKWSKDYIEYLQSLLCKKFDYEKFENEISYTIISYEKINSTTEKKKKKDKKDYNNKINTEIVENWQTIKTH